MLFATLLRYGVRTGALRVVDAGGREYLIGDGSKPRCMLRLKRRWLGIKLALNPALYVPEAYMDGDLTIEDGTLEDFIEVGARNYVHILNMPISKMLGRLRKLNRFRRFNPIAKARKNVAHHYDLSGQLYELFLDYDKQYSCAYFTDPSQSLETAQENKKRHIASKLLLKPGAKVLDIGSGWGGLAMYLSEVSDADVTGVTLSVEQHKVANQRAAAAGLAGKVRFALRDYREERQTYDRIVSVGMFEHVGVGNYVDFFTKIKGLLKDDGVCLLHSIGRLDGPGTTNPWLHKYIFPGGYSPALSEVMTAVQEVGLVVTDIEILRLHYAETLKAWRERFQRNRAKIAAIYDERFCRMWDLYLVMCEMAFRHDHIMVFQMQLAKQIDSVPITRDYMLDWERRQARTDSVRGLEAAG
jgi:cyclopropane-fatty-acyl-phospholipid synthase